MKTAKKSQARRTRRKVHTEEYRKGSVTWKLRHMIPTEGDKHKNPFWIADNCDSRNRKRVTGATKGEAIDKLNAYQDEIEKHGTAHSLDDDTREAVVRAKRITGGRATLDEIVRFWAERHPMDGNKITLADAVDQFMAEREALKNRPATIREIRQKLTAFKNAIGPETAIAGIWADDITRFMAGTGGGDVSRRAWKKVLIMFFRWCMEEPRKAIKSNPALSIVVPKATKKPPATWAARDVESFMRIVEMEAPEYAAAFAVLWFAGLRPTELTGQYGLEHEKITEAKSKLAQARTNYEAERMRLGLGQGRGGNVKKKAEAQARLDASPQATALTAAREHLARMQERHGGDSMPGLQWADICMDDDDEKFIGIRAETSKVLEPRHVEITPNLEAWLRKYRKIAGPLVANPTAFRRTRKRILEKMTNAKWTADVCRHSFASYHYKAHGDRDRLAAMMGHSAMSREIERHYKDATVSRADAEKFWEIVPDGETMPDGKRIAGKSAKQKPGSHSGPLRANA